ncbi:PEP/pyruvate-binding domain-containing protein [Gemmatimonadota bacterium]
MTGNPRSDGILPFDRSFFDSDQVISRIGSGSLGGKAQGLALVRQLLASKFSKGGQGGISVGIPRLVVITTDAFDAFMKRNDLFEVALSDLPDDRLAHAFQEADIPTEILGDLRGLIGGVHTPLAIRSSSLLEDALYRPFAGVYETKMIPNNQPDSNSRFQKLVEAIKFVYASTFFSGAKAYRKVIGESDLNEKMAVMIQEVVGERFGDRFYPHISGVCRSYSYYPTGRSRPEEGVVNLALGLGKTIVDGGVCWSYCPAYPKAPPPFGSVSQMLGETQTRLWAVNMGKPPAYDPVAETEYLTQADLGEAEHDGTLRYLASTYDGASDRLVPGMGREGPRVLDFALLLQYAEFPLNDLVLSLLSVSEEALGTDVEIEFAMTLPGGPEQRPRLGFLQVRPMVAPGEEVDIEVEELSGPGVIVASDRAMGNGVGDSIRDVVYAKPDAFESRHTRAISAEIEALNRQLVNEARPYLLIGFGRWGSSDPWLGIPVTWSQVTGAKVIVEATLDKMNVEPSQGSHFFHNLSSFQISYFTVRHGRGAGIDWEWLATQAAEAETEFVRHIRLAEPLLVRVDGRSGRGLITSAEAPVTTKTMA